MSYGESRFDFYSAGSNATATSGVAGFFGSYSGLSLLNNDDVVHLQISGSVNEFFMGPPSASISNNIGYKIYPSLSTIDFPPTRVGLASLLQVSQASPLGDMASQANASYNWVLWRRADVYKA